MSIRETRLLYGHGSHAGPRETNEDTVLCIELEDGRWLMGVADGMGGLEHGERASRTALGTLYKALNDGNGLAQAAQLANEAVVRESGGEKRGTTLVAALIKGTTVEIVNVGDSRAYHLDPLGLVQVTRDHTMGSEAEKEGAFTAAEVAASPWSNALARYLGAEKALEVDYFGPFEVEKGGWLLLCSDGFHRVFSMEEMEGELGPETDPEAAAGRLVQEALDRGTEDNVSVAVAYRPGPPRAQATVPAKTTQRRAGTGPSTPSTSKKVARRLEKKRKKWWIIALVLTLLTFGAAATAWWLA
jgi:protein phosphatase